MTFTETPFVVLLAAVYGLWLRYRSHDSAAASVLLIGSLIFYGYHAPALLPLILAYCLVDWAVALWIARSARPRLALTLGVVFNLAVLSFWKYTPMVLDALAQGAAAFNLPAVPQAPQNWLIPFGISFYAFTGVGYMVDVYRRRIPAEASFWRFTLFLTFFPQLVAGPILRGDEFLPALQPGVMPHQGRDHLEAMLFLGRGYFKKLVLADRIALAIDPFFSHVADPTTSGVWSLPYVYLYALQIYFDFSAYTDIARGLGLLFGFRWPDNFRLPYLACSVQDFWRRWHITLSLFLKDYLYVPLGGNRHGAWRTNVNLMLTMLLGGLWHGASWSFLLWGGLHGLFLVINRAWSQFAPGRWLAGLRGPGGAAWRVAATMLTFHAVCVAWCFFRLTDVSQSAACLRQWVRFDTDKFLVGDAADLSLWALLAAYGVLSLLAWRAVAPVEWIKARNHPVWVPASHGFQCGTALVLVALALLLSPGGEAPPFIYFQF